MSCNKLGFEVVMKKKSQDKPQSPLEIALREIAVTAGAEGIIIVSLRPETYPASTFFTFLRFDVKSENMILNILVKALQQDPDLRTKYQVKEFFLNEVHFYSKCAPRIRPILDKGNEEEPPKEVSVIVPTYYGHDLTEGMEWLAIEDIGPEYVVPRNVEELDKSHLKAAILALASFHSASLAWKTNNAAEFATVARLFTETEMLKTDDDPAKDVKTQKVTAALGAASRYSSTHLSGPYSVAAEKLYHTAFVEGPSWVSAAQAEPWTVITHGDCWAKNFLFKYDKNKNITGVAMVDFKCARAASPVLDVTNFLLSSGSADCLKDLRPFIEKHKDSMKPKMVDYRHHVRLFGCYGVVAALIHHYYGVIYPNLDVDEATCKINALEDINYQNDHLLSEPVVGKSRLTATEEKLAEASKKSAGQSVSINLNQTKTDEASRMRVALIIKAAHDVRIM